MNGEQKEALAKALRLCIFLLVSAVFRTVELETKGFPKATVEKEATGPALIAYCADSARLAISWTGAASPRPTWTAWQGVCKAFASNLSTKAFDFGG